MLGKCKETALCLMFILSVFEKAPAVFAAVHNKNDQRFSHETPRLLGSEVSEKVSISLRVNTALYHV